MAPRPRLTVGRSMSKKKYVDRISLLPDCILHDILSSLNTKQVVQTCVLSKRWKTVWTHIPTLNFKYKSYPFKGSTKDPNLKGRSFYQFISTVLSNHCGSHITKLSYSSRYLVDSKDQKHLVESLICYAASHMVQELRLHIDVVSDFDWTRSLSACHSLNALKLSCGLGCYLSRRQIGSCDEGGVLMLPSLRTLKIGNLCWEHLQEKVLLGCPNLESLVLVDFTSNGRATICAPKLENFEVRSPDISDLVELELSTPNLRCVKFDNILPFVKSTLDLPCLDKVNISEDYDACCVHGYGRKVIELLRVFHNARSITMPLSTTQAIFSVHAENLSLRKLRHLKLKASKKDLQYLLDSPSLETMVLDLN